MTEPDKKRRLPILQAPKEEPEEEPRPPWHWSGFGVVVSFLVWLPLVALVTALSARMVENAETPTVGPILLMLALCFLGFLVATFVSGFFIGKFGGEAGPREGAVSGFVTAAFAVALAAGGPGPRVGPVAWIVVLAIFGGSGALSGRLGAKVAKRNRRG